MTLYRKFLAYIIMPPALVIVIWVVKYIRTCCNKASEQQIGSQHINATLLVLFLFGPIVSANIFRLFVSAIVHQCTATCH